MNYISTLVTVCVFFFATANANLYGIWQTGSTANFGEISVNTGVPTMKLEFPNFSQAMQGNSAMNNLTSVFTFILRNTINSAEFNFLVSVNVATNKVIYFATIPEGSYPHGLKYDSDVNSLKCVLQGGDNSTWLVGEMDPASASYDVYGQVEGSLLSTGLSPYTHSYFVVVESIDTLNTTMYSFDTRSGDLTNNLTLVFPPNYYQGPMNLLYVPSLDILICNILMSDQYNNIGMDYATIDLDTGIVKPLSIFTPQQVVSVVTHAAHESLIYAAVEFNGNLQFITIDLTQSTQTSNIQEPTFIVSMGYFTNF
eukprot:gene12490-14661_t